MVQRQPSRRVPERAMVPAAVGRQAQAQAQDRGLTGGDYSESRPQTSLGWLMPVEYAPLRPSERPIEHGEPTLRPDKNRSTQICRGTAPVLSFTVR